MNIFRFKHIFLFQLFLLMIVLQGSLSAQTVTWSQAITDDKKMQFLKIIGTDDDGFYILRSNISFETARDHSGFRTRRYGIEYFDFEMHLKWSKQLTASIQDAKIIAVQLINDKILVISSTAEKKTKLYRIYAQYMNGKGDYEDEPVLLEEMNYEKISDDSKPDIILSQDQSKAVCAFRKVPAGDNAEQDFGAIVIDTCLRVLYKKEIVVPVDIRHFTSIDFVLTNDGDFCLLGIKFLTDKKVKAPNESFYQLYTYNFSRDEIMSNEIKIEDKFLTDAGISADNLNKKIVVAGFYSDETTYSTAGIFYFSVSENNPSQTVVRSTPFSTSFLTKFLGERKISSKELMNYTIDRLILRKDGGVAILAESYYETTSSYWDYYTQTYISHRYYHFGNIMVLSVNPDGGILWSNSISKDQNSTDDGGYLSSYCSLIASGRIYSIYNKYIDQESSVLITTVDGTGQQKTDVLFNEMKNISVVPQSAKQIDAETLLLPAYRENKFYIAKIEF